MPGRSKKQQMAAGAALAAKRGERSKASLKGASRQMVETMSERQFREFAGTKRRGLPRMSAPLLGDSRGSESVIVPSPRDVPCAASPRTWRICIRSA